MTTETAGVPLREVSLEEGWEIIDRAARHYLDMGGEEFLRAWQAGELDDDRRPGVWAVSMLLPLSGRDGW